MVRALVGACLSVGEAKLAAGRPAELREGRERTSEFKVMPARGLTLIEVGYPPDAELAARTEQTRARRPDLGAQSAD
jgi:tRNA pseudouridine38-40 synthase